LPRRLGTDIGCETYEDLVHFIRAVAGAGLGPCSCSRGRAVACRPIRRRSAAVRPHSQCGFAALPCVALPRCLVWLCRAVICGSAASSCAALPRCPLPHVQIVRSLSGARQNRMEGQPGWMPSRSDGAGPGGCVWTAPATARAAPCAGVTHFVIHARHCLLKDPKVNTSQNRSIPPLCAPAPFHCGTHSTKHTSSPHRSQYPQYQTNAPRVRARPAAARLRGLRGPAGRSTDGRRRPLRGNARSRACALARTARRSVRIAQDVRLGPEADERCAPPPTLCRCARSLRPGRSRR
jgi:hypothetical protein